jgi:hypothetical protein
LPKGSVMLSWWDGTDRAWGTDSFAFRWPPGRGMHVRAWLVNTVDRRERESSRIGIFPSASEKAALSQNKKTMYYHLAGKQVRTSGLFYGLRHPSLQQQGPLTLLRSCLVQDDAAAAPASTAELGVVVQPVSMEGIEAQESTVVHRRATLRRRPPSRAPATSPSTSLPRYGMFPPHALSCLAPGPCTSWSKPADSSKDCCSGGYIVMSWRA